MSAEENKAIIRRWMDECYGPGNWALMDELFAPDFVNHDPAAPQARDREGLKQFAAAQLAGFPDRQATIEDLIAEGDKVTKRTTFRGTQTGEFVGIPPTGKPVALMTLSIYRLRDGKIVECWWGYDNLSALQQLGVIPVPGQ